MAPPVDAALACVSGLASVGSGCLAALAAGGVWVGCEVAA